MSDTPDVSKIVSMIMERPELIAEISGMLKSSDSDGEQADSPPAEKASVTVDSKPQGEDSKRVHRMKLAQAMKPYLSSERAHAIDAMMSIVDILELTWGRR